MKSTPTKGSTIGCLIFMVLFVVFAVMLCTPESKELTAEEIEIERIEEFFSLGDGSHIELTRMIKASLKDPESYEHIETTYRVQGDTVWVFTNYRAKNSFGALVPEGVTGITSASTGKVIEWVYQE